MYQYILLVSVTFPFSFSQTILLPVLGSPGTPSWSLVLSIQKQWIQGRCPVVCKQTSVIESKSTFTDRRVRCQEQSTSKVKYTLRRESGLGCQERSARKPPASGFFILPARLWSSPCHCRPFPTSLDGQIGFLYNLFSKPAYTHNAFSLPIRKGQKCNVNLS